MTVLIKNVKNYDISEYSFSLDYDSGVPSFQMNPLLAVAGITSNSISTRGVLAGDHYKTAINGVNTYSETNLNSDSSTQPVGLLISFYKNNVAAAEVTINGTVKISLKKYIVSKFKELSQRITLLVSDPVVDETVEGGSENG